MSQGIHPQHLRMQVIRPTLERMGKWSYAAEDLLMGTAAQESHMGTYLKQLGNGPAVGIMQIEPATAKDIIFRYIAKRKKIEADFEKGFQIVNTADIDWATVSLEAVTTKLQTDLAFCVAVARMKYAMIPEPLPAIGDLDGYANYWKKYYNTAAGDGMPSQFIANYRRFKCAEK